MDKTLTANAPPEARSRRSASLWTLPAAVFHAAHDAGRAARLAPRWHSLVQNGKRRPWRWYEVLGLKVIFGIRTFRRSLDLRRASAVVVPRLPTEGVGANFLHVIEVMHRVRPDAHVHVNWIIDGTEFGFRYGEIGDDVWLKLFAPIGTPPAEPFTLALTSLDNALWGDGKDFLSGRTLARERRAYHRTIAKWIRPANARVLREIETIVTGRFHGRLAIGIHRRVPNLTVANTMDDGRVPTPEDFLAHVHARVRAANAADWVVFLATDDAAAVPAFREALGDRLVVRDGVQRTTADASEVHCGHWEDVSVRDAEDALIDLLLLARCDAVLHGSSSVTTAVALLNPDLPMVRVRTTAAPPAAEQLAFALPLPPRWLRLMSRRTE